MQQPEPVFRSQRRGARHPAPSEAAALWRTESAARAALAAIEGLGDRMEQLEFSVAHFLDGEEGALPRLRAIEDRLDLWDSGPDRAVTARLDHLAEMLATLSARMVQQAAPQHRAPEPGDLDRLPGIGPGLVRMLEKTGLTRIEELACADPVRLRDALGPVGDVLDTGFLVARARDWVQPADTGPDPMRAAG